MVAAKRCRIKLHTAPARQLHFNPGIKRLELGCAVVKVASLALYSPKVRPGLWEKSRYFRARRSERAKRDGKKGKVSSARSV